MIESYIMKANIDRHESWWMHIYILVDQYQYSLQKQINIFNIKLEINLSDPKNSILELASVANLRNVLPNCIKENLFIVKVVLVH